MSDNATKLVREIVPVPSDRLWFDPRIIVATCETLFTTIPTPAGVDVLIASPDPTRIAIGVSYDGFAAAGCRIAPWPDVISYPFALATAGHSDWYWIHQYLSLVNVGWWAHSSGGGNVRVTTVRRV